MLYRASPSDYKISTFRGHFATFQILQLGALESFIFYFETSKFCLLILKKMTENYLAIAMAISLVTLVITDNVLAIAMAILICYISID
jgi:hypothetical protein